MTGYCCNFSIRAPPAAPPATLDAVTMRRVDPRVRSAEVASKSSVTRRIEPELSRRPGHSSASVVHRVRIRRHPARDEADASWDPRHRRLSSAVRRGSRTRGHPDPDRSIVGGPEVAVMRVALVNAPLLSAVCDHGVGHQMPLGLLMVGGALRGRAAVTRIDAASTT